MTLKEVKKNLEELVGRKYNELCDLVEGVYECFGDYSYDGEEHIIADCSSFGEVTAYADHIDAPEFHIAYNAETDEDGEFETITVTGVELYER